MRTITEFENRCPVFQAYRGSFPFNWPADCWLRLVPAEEQSPTRWSEFSHGCPFTKSSFLLARRFPSFFYFIHAYVIYHFDEIGPITRKRARLADFNDHEICCRVISEIGKYSADRVIVPYLNVAVFRLKFSNSSFKLNKILKCKSTGEFIRRFSHSKDSKIVFTIHIAN